MSLAEQFYFGALLIAFLAFSGAIMLGIITSSHPPPPEPDRRSRPGHYPSTGDATGQP